MPIWWRDQRVRDTRDRALLPLLPLKSTRLTRNRTSTYMHVRFEAIGKVNIVLMSQFRTSDKRLRKFECLRVG